MARRPPTRRDVGLRTLAGVLGLLLAVAAPPVQADPPRALPPGELPTDRRLGALRSLSSNFPFQAVDSPTSWKQRAAELDRRVRIATGLWPKPTATPLRAVVHGRVERPEYVVDRVFFESLPGHFVTGSLYRPAGKAKEGSRPAVLCPHGHWSNGRFHDHGEAGVRREIATGAERFEVGGRHPLQARCVQLARMGCVVFHYDMLGYGDSLQFTEHRPGVRPPMNTAENWGFFSPQAELRLQNTMGLQTLNSVRAVDFVLSLPEVDPKRIAVTGASGGGTQTFLLAAVDPRIALSFPAVMVSTAMQGGCVCENAPYLRIDAGNIDLAALAAPRPLGLIAADDWTKELATEGLPDLRRLYQMLGHKDRISAGLNIHFKHNYNAVNRTLLYNFLNRHFRLGLKEPVLEKDYQPLSRSEMTVWTAKHPPPGGEQIGDAHERHVARWLTEDARKQIDALVPKDATSLARYRQEVGGAWRILIGRELADLDEIRHELKDKVQRPGILQMTGLIHSDRHGEQIPVLWLYPEDNWNGQVVLYLTDTGKAGLLTAEGAVRPAVAELVSGGLAVAGVDLLDQGEFTNDGRSPKKQRVQFTGNGKQPWHHYAAYTYGYNPPLFARRVHDTLTTLWLIGHHPRKVERIHLVGEGATGGPVAAAARALAGKTIDRTAIDTAGFRFVNVDRLDHPMFVPGAVKYDDVPGLLALCAPAKLRLVGEGKAAPAVTQAAYGAAGEATHLVVPGGDTELEPAIATARWIMQAD